jgi:hypothetical protein
VFAIAIALPSLSKDICGQGLLAYPSGQPLHVHIRIVSKALRVKNTLACYDKAEITTVKSFMVQAPALFHFISKFHSLL